ncbi:hypothetical protein FOA52_014256 [Chlamydomonas sp. UWO 241]|nr:hypothetical protein FOA52_014256 [Chlamydomonas sp. UWO 241]
MWAPKDGRKGRDGAPSATQTVANLKQDRIKAKKSLGQNFLTDDAILRDIVVASGVKAGDLVLEVGPGTGNLTKHLLERGARVTAVEKDDVLWARLEAEYAQEPNLTLVRGDVLRKGLVTGVIRDMVAQARPEGSSGSDGQSGGASGSGSQAAPRVKVVANLPYNITKDFLIAMLPLGDIVSELSIMIQEEAAVRLCDKKVGRPDYRSMNIRVNFYSVPKYRFLIKKEKYFPAPGVDGALVTFKLLPKSKRAPVGSERGFLALVGKAFLERRKMMRNSVDPMYTPAQVEAALRVCGLRTDARAQDLSLADFVGVHAELKKNAVGEMPSDVPAPVPPSRTNQPTNSSSTPAPARRHMESDQAYDDDGPRVSHGGQSSRFRGVTFNKKSKKWQSVLNVGGSHVHLGTFNTEEDAAVAFDRAALMVRGDKARINFGLTNYMDPATGQIIEDPALRVKIDSSCDPNRPKRRAPAKEGRGGGRGGGGDDYQQQQQQQQAEQIAQMAMAMQAQAGSYQHLWPAQASGVAHSGSPASPASALLSMAQGGALAPNLADLAGAAAGAGGAAKGETDEQTVLHDPQALTGFFDVVNAIRHSLPEGCELQAIVPSRADPPVAGAVYMQAGGFGCCLLQAGQLCGYTAGKGSLQEAIDYVAMIVSVASALQAGGGGFGVDGSVDVGVDAIAAAAAAAMDGGHGHGAVDDTTMSSLAALQALIAAAGSASSSTSPGEQHAMAMLQTVIASSSAAAAGTSDAPMDAATAAAYDAAAAAAAAAVGAASSCMPGVNGVGGVNGVDSVGGMNGVDEAVAAAAAAAGAYCGGAEHGSGGKRGAEEAGIGGGGDEGPPTVVARLE